MAKKTGLGGALWVDEFDLSGDTSSASISGGPAALDVTGIDKSGIERIGGLRDGSMSIVEFFNPGSGKAHPVLKLLPTGDTIVSYLQGTTVGSAAASCIGKQIGYDGSRSADGGLTFSVDVQASQLGVVWGLAGTPGLVTDTAVGTEATVDNLAATTGGLRAFLHVTAFSGTDATVVVAESSDNFSGDDDPIASFTSIVGVGSEAIAVSGAIERYLRVAISVDNFTTMTWGVVFARGG